MVDSARNSRQRGCSTAAAAAAASSSPAPNAQRDDARIEPRHNRKANKSDTAIIPNDGLEAISIRSKSKASALGRRAYV